MMHDPEEAETTVDLTNCADEPIHVPGRIQPHGVLLVLDEPDLVVRQASANAGMLGAPLDAVLGARFEALVDPSEREEVRRWLLSEDVHEANPRRIRIVAGGASATFEGLAHRHRGPLILELEDRREAGEPTTPDLAIAVRRVMTRLEAAKSLQEFCRVAAVETRALTGFERVLVYRFDEDWHGQVYAEDKADFLTPLMHLHFPASDIPEQARRLYSVNRLRMIADSDAEAVPLVPALDPATGRPLDLSFAGLRAVSPIHIRYLKNMGTKTSMSFSLMRDGRLWGLLGCMNYSKPLYLPPTLRSACEFLAALVSVQLAVKEDGEGNEYRTKLQQVRERLLQRMAEETDLARALVDDGGDLLELTGARGAAVVQERTCETLGVTPDKDQVMALVDWLRAQADVDVFATDSLPRIFPEALAYKDAACGLVAVTTSRAQGRYVLWFRPEVVQTVEWAGDPSKPVEPGGSLSPRTSFDLWKEEVHLKSLPWHPAEVAAARALRDAIIAVVVRRAEELTRLNAELERSNNDLDAFAFTTSHDMKEPLRGIHNYATFLMEDYGDRLDAEGVSRLESLVRLSQRMEDLVESMLRYSRLGRADLVYEEVDLTELVEEVVELHRVMLGENHVKVTVPRPLPTVRCDRVQVGQLLSNLVTNAIKYNDRPERSIEIGWREPAAPGGPAVFYVKDDGIGIPEKHHQNVFRLFKRLHGRDKFGGGTGAGLTFSKKIVERHGGAIWIESTPDEGSTFNFTLTG
ncbi:ATP-binding protein [Paludisphaera mucosa]|uniref:histidine kinase n=1 Tax=Paludisphaera mucosa TaxID=3030827 RepID=A0ABT6FI29_9BACT|nr:ATP-binding protein [Paludisphaera mucosa]MDG3007033.1 ATP-binding protein [Paludisphaera mucosa]